VWDAAPVSQVVSQRCVPGSRSNHRRLGCSKRIRGNLIRSAPPSRLQPRGRGGTGRASAPVRRGV
jgi:hypothetical protein